MHRLAAILRFLFPAWLLLAGLAGLAISGFQLHWMPRFEGLAWGLTELGHTWGGWIVTGIAAGYLVHHLRKRWGDWRRLQRLLGLALVATLAALVGTGWLLSTPMASRPGWALPTHFVATFALIALAAVHARPRRRREAP